MHVPTPSSSVGTNAPGGPVHPLAIAVIIVQMLTLVVLVWMVVDFRERLEDTELRVRALTERVAQIDQRLTEPASDSATRELPPGADSDAAAESSGAHP